LQAISEAALPRFIHRRAFEPLAVNPITLNSIVRIRVNEFQEFGGFMDAAMIFVLVSIAVAIGFIVWLRYFAPRESKGQEGSGDATSKMQNEGRVKPGSK
jgi:hypothetical protein